MKSSRRSTRLTCQGVSWRAVVLMGQLNRSRRGTGPWFQSGNRGWHDSLRERWRGRGRSRRFWVVRVRTRWGL